MMPAEIPVGPGGRTEGQDPEGRDRTESGELVRSAAVRRSSSTEGRAARSARAEGGKEFLRTFLAVLARPIRPSARLLLPLLLLPLALSFAFPLWRIRMVAPQYPKGLHLDIYAYKLDGGNRGHDVAELNNLNHYIGMRKLERSSIPELGWIPFAFGILGLLTLRAAVLGSIRDLVDLGVLLVYTTGFFLARFILMLWTYGHDLAPTAALKVEPFMPVVIGTKRIANFTTQSYPLLGTLLVGVFAGGILGITAWHFRKEWRGASVRGGPPN